MPRLDLGYTVFAGIQGGVTGFLASTGVTAAAGGATARRASAACPASR